MLRFQIDGAWSGKVMASGVLNPMASEMAVIYDGTGDNKPAFVLAAGVTLPSEIGNLVPYDLAGLKERKQQVESGEGNNPTIIK